MLNQPSQKHRLDIALASIRAICPTRCDVALVLGSGLGDVADQVKNPVMIPYDQITGFPVSTAPGHAGQLVIGELYGRQTVLMQGRFHLYEGWAPRDIALSVYVLAGLGARVMIVTNAAGGLNPDFDAGDIMLITDHINQTGLSPLIGPNDDEIGLRFPDLLHAYDPELLAITERSATGLNVPLRKGVYAGVTGPALETPAERRFLRIIGGDAVGMSTVHEVIAANHAGMKVVGISAITNKATGGPDQKPDTVEDVLAHARISATQIKAILARLVPAIPG